MMYKLYTAHSIIINFGCDPQVEKDWVCLIGIRYVQFILFNDRNNYKTKVTASKYKTIIL